jgi:hypothetical protein
MLDCADLAEESQAGMASMREQGLRLACAARTWRLCKLHAETLVPLATHLELPLGHPDFAAHRALAKQADPPLAVVVQNFPGWREFDVGRAGRGRLLRALCTTPRPRTTPGALSPQGVFILQLMQMVQENADVRHIEGVLKRDAALSYKLFRYINSPAFGIEVEIESLRHAVTMLGYTPLFRWLSVLLATTNTAGYSHALLQAAIVRGPLCRAAGQGLAAARRGRAPVLCRHVLAAGPAAGHTARKGGQPDRAARARGAGLAHREGVYRAFPAAGRGLRAAGTARSWNWPRRFS